MILADKVVQMSRLFGVTADFLLKDELSEEEPAPEGCVNHSAMQALLEEEDYTRENKAKSPVIGAVMLVVKLIARRK